MLKKIQRFFVNQRNALFPKQEISLFAGVNFFARKMAGMASPVSEISVKEDDKVHISMVTSFMTQEDCFKLGEEFEKDMRGNKMVVIFLYK